MTVLSPITTCIIIGGLFFVARSPHQQSKKRLSLLLSVIWNYCSLRDFVDGSSKPSFTSYAKVVQLSR